MRLIVIDKTNCRSIGNFIFEQLKEILMDLNKEYPFFESWLNKVFLELQTTYNRYIIVCVDQSNKYVRGVAILKKTNVENKICTLRVVSSFKRMGIGTSLLQKSIEVLKDKKPLITVPGIHMKEFAPFLKNNGFVLKDQVKSIYIKGAYEYFFNVPYEHKTVLISVHPEYVSKIISGEKNIEFRKTSFSPSVERVYIYSSAPTKKIVGFFNVNEVIKDTPQKLWDKYSTKGCIDKEKYDEYYSHHSIAVGILIEDFFKFIKPVNPKLFDKDFRAPQSFCYIDNVRQIKWLEEQQIEY